MFKRKVILFSSNRYEFTRKQHDVKMFMLNRCKSFNWWNVLPVNKCSIIGCYFYEKSQYSSKRMDRYVWCKTSRVNLKPINFVFFDNLHVYCVKTMLGSSLLQVVCRNVHVLFMLFVYSGVQRIALLYVFTVLVRFSVYLYIYTSDNLTQQC